MATLCRRLLPALLFLLVPALFAAEPRVLMRTSQGDLEITLYPEKAPKTVANFLRYVDEGFYDGTLFHRVIPGFVIQGGGYTADMERKPVHEPVENEARNGLKNERGTIAMARTRDPHSATSQFYINLKDNPSLDHPGFDGWGYTVFGRVTRGMAVADSIAAVPTGRRHGMKDVPLEPVVIHSVRRIR